MRDDWDHFDRRADTAFRIQLIVLLVFSLALAIVIVLMTMRQAKAEPGDKYDARPWVSSSASSRPAECPTRAWCGCWLANRFGLSDRALWNARHWAKVGRPAHGGCIGCVAVLSRGRGGHVGVVTGYVHGNPEILSGNHNNAVGTGVYPRARDIAYREM